MCELFPCAQRQNTVAELHGSAIPTLAELPEAHSAAHYGRYRRPHHIFLSFPCILIPVGSLVDPPALESLHIVGDAFYGERAVRAVLSAESALLFASVKPSVDSRIDAPDVSSGNVYDVVRPLHRWIEDRFDSCGTSVRRIGIHRRVARPVSRRCRDLAASGLLCGASVEGEFSPMAHCRWSDRIRDASAG